MGSFWTPARPNSETEERLTLEQEKIVLSNARVILASACPGSGKSTTLAARVRRLWSDWGEPILVCTFSNKAAEDIGRKINLRDVPSIRVSTIHKLGFDLVKEHWDLLREIWGSALWPEEARLCSKEDELKLLAEYREGKSGFDQLDVDRLYEKIAKLRDIKQHPTVVQQLIRSGFHVGRTSGVEVDFWGGYETYRLAHGQLLFQDMIDLARSLMTMPEVSSKLRSKYHHFLLDEAQDTSVEQWDLLRPLISECRTSLIVFDQNQRVYGWRGADCGPLYGLGFLQGAVQYRLSKSFRSGQNIAALANEVVPDGKSQIITDKPGGQIVVLRCKTAEEEAGLVLGLALESQSVAVLARTNAYLEPMERLCVQQGRPFRGNSFYRAAHLRKFCETLEEVSGLETWSRILKQAFVDNMVFTAEERSDFAQALRLVKDLGAEQFLSVWRAAQNLEEGGLTLITGHASKGLEWDRVFVVGLHDSHVPHHLSHDQQEEHNLFYVMITRAREQMYLSWVGNKPSPFLPQHVLDLARPGT